MARGRSAETAKPSRGLDELLEDRQHADQVYRLSVRLENLHATQGRNDGTTPLTHQAINETRDTTHTEGVPTGEQAVPQQRRRGRQANVEKQVQTYRFERNGKPGEILLEVGGPYGLMSKALRDAMVASNKAKYWMPSASLIKFVAVNAIDPLGVYIQLKAETTIDARSFEEEAEKPPLPRMEPRNKTGGMRTMVPVFHERLSKPIHFDVRLIINAECPRTPEEIAGLLHAMQSVPFGPARRGEFRVLKASREQ
jgi:hypothetical protein